MNKTQNKRSQFTPIAFLVLTLALAFTVDAQIAGGGDYTLDQSVIATGGGTSTGGSYITIGTGGQSIAGTNSSGQSIGVKGGFWTAQSMVTTAAAVTIGGRVTTAAGQGITNVVITLTQTDGTVSFARSSSFGYYRFDEIVVGQTVIITAAAKHFQFSQPTQVVSLYGETNDIDFVAIN